MKLQFRGADLIKKYEVLKLKAYHGKADPEGVWTIGYGHTKDVHKGMEITQVDANGLFDQDVEDYTEAVRNSVNLSVTTQAQFDAMVSLAFNIGVDNFESSSVLRFHNAGEHFAVCGAFLMWNISNGERRRGLIRRRCAEARLYCGDKFIKCKSTDGEIVK
jgi:lysozyme